MATQLGTVNVPMAITISAGNPPRHLATVTTEMTLSITGEPRPIGASSTVVQPDTAALRTSVAYALREAADQMEHEDLTQGDRIYLTR